VPFVTKGADVMGPGIVDADPEIKVGDLVWVREMKFSKALAIGEALANGDEMLAKKPGKLVKSIAYVGDKLWKYGED
jgi:predicted RNA-binding protein (TIGR00451 family)